MKPLIGVLPLFHQGDENLWINHYYFDGIINAGGIPYLLPLLDDESELELLCHQFDGYLFTGGQDVDPALYGEEKIPECSYQAPRRDSQELFMLKRLLQLDKPCLGVCRGLQMINVACGGTMYQDLPTQFGTDVDHSQMGKEEFTRPFHSVQLVTGTKLHSAIGETALMVNSMHHQAVKDIPDCLAVAARSDDGLVEALEHKTAKCFFGVQWHPEFLWPEHDHAKAIFRLLTDAAKNS